MDPGRRCRRQVDALREELAELRATWAADQEALQDAVDSARTVRPPRRRPSAPRLMQDHFVLPC